MTLEGQKQLGRAVVVAPKIALAVGEADVPRRVSAAAREREEMIEGRIGVAHFLPADVAATAITPIDHIRIYRPHEATPFLSPATVLAFALLFRVGSLISAGIGAAPVAVSKSIGLNLVMVTRVIGLLVHADLLTVSPIVASRLRLPLLRAGGITLRVVGPLLSPARKLISLYLLAVSGIPPLPSLPQLLRVFRHEEAAFPTPPTWYLGGAGTSGIKAILA